MKNVVYIAVCIVALLSSCNKVEDLNPSVTEVRVVKSEKSTTKDKTFPGDLVFIEGSGLGNVTKVIFRPVATPDIDGISASFNSAINSNQLLTINIPWDDTKGSQFGENSIEITNSGGEVVVTEIVIDQPKPTIKTVLPIPKEVSVGSVITVTGSWFQGISTFNYVGAITTDVTSIKIETKDEVTYSKFTFIAPVQKPSGAFELTTPGGEVKFDIYPANVFANFDGSGIVENKDWKIAGDVSTGPIFDKTDAPVAKDGKYLYITQLASSTTNGWGNVSVPISGQAKLDTFLGQTDPAKVTLTFDYYVPATTEFQAQFTVGSGGYQIDIESRTREAWTTYSVKLSELSVGWGGLPAKMANVQSIGALQFSLKTPTADTWLAIDNVKITAEALPEDLPTLGEIITPNGPEKIMGNDIVIIKGTSLADATKVYTTADGGITQVDSEILSNSATQLILKVIFETGTSVYGENKLIVEYPEGKKLETMITIVESGGSPAPVYEALTADVVIADFNDGTPWNSFGFTNAETKEVIGTVTTKDTDPNPKDTASGTYMYVTRKGKGNPGVQKQPLDVFKDHNYDPSKVAIQFDYYAKTDAKFGIRLLNDTPDPTYKGLNVFTNTDWTIAYGAWTTVTISLDTFLQGYGGDGDPIPDLTKIKEMQFNPSADGEFALDNIKLVLVPVAP